MSGRDIIFLVDDPKWNQVRGLKALLKRAASETDRVCAFEEGGFSVLLSTDQKLRLLNREFRGKDKPTNVLSFPASANNDGYRGDIAMAYGVTAREAKAAGKSLRDHAAHLLVHGMLHLA